MSKLRALLVLGRVSNLPTVWSNCLAAWWLGNHLEGYANGHADWTVFGWLCAGASLVYLGGMYLNDAFDVRFDREFRPERPIPSGAVGAGAVWALGLVWLLGGGAILVAAAGASWHLVLLLVLAVLVYDATHKWIAFAPLLMAACRSFLYLVAASSGSFGITGIAVWGAVVMAAYIVGLSAVARCESAPNPFQRAPLVLLAAPIILALVVNNDEYRAAGLVLGFALGGWILLSLRHTLNTTPPNIGRTVGGLLAGIPLVDLLAVGWVSPELTVVFAGLFAGALLAQRFVPAT